MSLRLQIASVFRKRYKDSGASSEKMWRDTDEIINKVLDAAVESINADFDDEEIAPDANFADGVYMSLEAINKLRDEK